jgi:MerR family transcriptional regulator, heat shock protein HspR
MEWPDTNHGVFAISVAAELAGLHPQTLRIYEREGLVEPARSSGGTRRYSGEDVDRLRLIADLTTAGLNLAGVKRVLALEAELEAMRATIERLERERSVEPRR